MYQNCHTKLLLKSGPYISLAQIQTIKIIDEINKKSHFVDFIPNYIGCILFVVNTERNIHKF